MSRLIDADAFEIIKVKTKAGVQTPQGLEQAPEQREKERKTK